MDVSCLNYPALIDHEYRFYSLLLLLVSNGLSIENHLGEVYLQDVTIFNNQASNEGGGLFCSDSL